MKIAYYKKVFLILFLPFSISLFGMEMNLNEIPKDQAEPELLSLTLEDQVYTFSLESILKHIKRYQKGIDSTGQAKLLGFHHYRPLKTQELAKGITLFKVQDNLWVLALGDSTKFHKGYVIYQGKAFSKTFFPTSWDKDSIGSYLTYLFTSSKHSIKIKNHPDGLTKTYGVTLTDTNGQALSCIIHGCRIIPQSMRLVTIYPVLSALPEPEHLSLTLKTLAYEQMQKLQAITKVYIPNPELIAALQSKDSERAFQFLSLDSDANVCDSKGKSALMYAATAGDWVLVNTLLEYGADPLAQDNDGNTAFHYALESGDYFTALGLINPHLINKANKQGTTPLGIALKNKNIEALELLLQFKANITLPDTFGSSPLMLAVKAYQGKADLAFSKAAITLLLQAGADVNAQDKGGNTALHFAVESSSKDLVQLLISAHACLSTFNAKNETALMLAKKLNYTPIVMFLESIEKEKLEWLQESKGSELMYAVKIDNIPEVKKLLAKGVNVNAQDSYCWTALTYAIEKRNNKLVTLLLETGADPCIKLSSGHSVLSYAQSQGNTFIIKALEKKIAELETPALENKKKEQEYLKACLTQFKDDLDEGELSKETLSALPLFKNKVLNAKSGITPLLYAVKEKKHKVIQQLLEHGADITAVDNQKHDALALAYAQSDLETLKILLQHSPYSRITELLIQALTENNDEISKLLCTQVNGLAYQALIKALRDGNQALVNKLVTQPLTPTEAGQALIIALEKGNSDAARLIIKACPQVVTFKDSNGMTPLMHSTSHNFLELVKLLVESGADIHAVDNNNKHARDYTSSRNPIYHYLSAQEQSFEQIKKHVQEKEAKELHKQELQQKQWPELAIAVSIGDTVFVNEYQDNEVNAVTPEGETPLLIAAKNNNEDLVSLLLNKPHIDVNARDKSGYTALMYAALNNNALLVTMLLKHNAQPCIANSSKNTAYDLTKTKKNTDPSIKALLKQAQETAAGNFARLMMDKEGLKEISSALPIVFPSSYFTPELLRSLITVSYKHHFSSTFQLLPENKFNPIDFLRQMVDDPQVLQSNLDKALLDLAKEANSCDKIMSAKSLLNAGANVNAKDSEGWTPLIHSVGKRDIQMVKFLLDAHANLDEKDILLGQSALMLSMFIAICSQTEGIRGDFSIAELLIKAGADVNTKTLEGPTLLRFAVEKGDLKAVKLLLNAKADVNLQDSTGKNALMCALALNKHPEIIQLLIKADTAINAKDALGETSLTYAIANGQANTVKLLLDAGADVNAKDNNGITSLIYASDKGQYEITQCLLKSGADVNAQDKEGRTPLMAASEGGYTKVAKLLVAAGAHVNVKNKNGVTALIYTVEKGHIEIIKLLLQAGASVDVQDNRGITPLMYASIQGNPEMVKLLLEAGADLSIKDTKDQTALSYAAGINIKAALAAFNIQDKNDLTSLTYAEEKKSIEIVKLLLQAGASVDVQSKEGTTPLMNAAARNHTEIVKLLLEARADSSIKDTKGQTALTYAKYAEVSRLHSTIELLTQSLDNFQKKNGATP